MNTQPFAKAKKVKELPTVHFAFQLGITIVFEVQYYRCGNNQNKYFTTSAASFDRRKTDWNQCGQAQETLLKGFGKAMSFYKKWDIMHLKELTTKQYNEMLSDIELLKNQYNFTQSDMDINFSQLKALSIQPVKKVSKTLTQA